MIEEEIVCTFIKTYDLPYFEDIFCMTESSFAAIVNKFEKYDEFVKIKKKLSIYRL